MEELFTYIIASALYKGVTINVAYPNARPPQMTVAKIIVIAFSERL